MRLQPGLNRDAIVGASYSEIDADVNPFRLNLAFADKAVELGARIFTHEAAQEILLRNGGRGRASRPTGTCTTPPSSLTPPVRGPPLLAKWWG